MAKGGGGKGGMGSLFDGVLTGVVVFGLIKVVDVISTKVGVAIPS